MGQNPFFGPPTRWGNLSLLHSPLNTPICLVVTISPLFANRVVLLISMAEQSPAGGGVSLARESTATTTLSSCIEVNVGCQLYGFLSMCIYRFLPTVLSKKPFQIKRKKRQELGSEGATCKNGTTYIFLNELCESHNLPKSGSKEDLIQRLLKHYFVDPAVPYAVQTLANQKWFIKSYKTQGFPRFPCWRSDTRQLNLPLVS